MKVVSVATRLTVDTCSSLEAKRSRPKFQLQLNAPQPPVTAPASREEASQSLGNEPALSLREEGSESLLFEFDKDELLAFHQQLEQIHEELFGKESAWNFQCIMVNIFISLEIYMYYFFQYFLRFTNISILTLWKTLICTLPKGSVINTYCFDLTVFIPISIKKASVYRCIPLG